MKEKNVEKELHALSYLGNSFIKIPRKIITRMFSLKDTERSLGQIHFALFCMCNHTEGIVRLGNHYIKCRRGEYAGSYRELSDASGLSLGATARWLKRLQEMHLIDICKVPGGSRISVYGYNDFSFSSDITKMHIAVKEEKEEAADAAARMREAEKKIGGRRMPSSRNKNVN